MDKWDNWIFLFLGLVLAYGLEFTRPWIKSLYNKSIFSSKKKRIEAIKQEYKEIDFIFSNSEFVTPYILQKILRRLSSVIGTLGFFFFFVPPLAKLIGQDEMFPSAGISVSIALICLALYIPLREVSTWIDNFIYFGSYREDVANRLTQLGVKPKEFPEGLVDKK